MSFMNFDLLDTLANLTLYSIEFAFIHFIS